MRLAEIQTTHEEANQIAGAIRPDNTTDMRTMVENGTVRTTITRDSTGGLHMTLDDYLVNLQVASRLGQKAQTENMTTTANTQSQQ